MSFKYGFVLFLIPAFLLLHRWWVRSMRAPAFGYSVKLPSQWTDRRYLWIQLALRYGGVTLLLVALARPQIAHQSRNRTVSGVDIMMVLDISRSMAAEDLADRSRLVVAKETMVKFIRGRDHDRIGLVVFSGEPLTLAPPTLDYPLVIKAMQEAEMGVLRDGTGIGDGLALAVNRLRDSTAKSKIIVLLTDGDNNIGQVGPLDAGELAAGYGMKVYTIAIGKEGRIRIPLNIRGASGALMQYQYQDNALNTELLEKIAEMTQGKFYRVQALDKLDQVFQEIDQLEKTEIKTKERVRYEEKFTIPLGWGLLVLLMEQLLFSFIGWPLLRRWV